LDSKKRKLTMLIIKFKVFLLLFVVVIFTSCSSEDSCKPCQDELAQVRLVMDELSSQALQISSVMKSLNDSDSLSTIDDLTGFDTEKITEYLEQVDSRRKLAENQIDQINQKIESLAGVKGVDDLISYLNSMKAALESKKREMSVLYTKLEKANKENEILTGKYRVATKTIEEKEQTISEIEKQKQEALEIAEQNKLKAEKSEQSLQAEKIFKQAEDKYNKAMGIKTTGVFTKNKTEKKEEKKKLLQEAQKLYIQANELGHTGAAYKANKAGLEIKNIDN